ncbi:hypothetical protein EPI10_021728 [Gossypium australe]|uniref:Uncharacterized protein n=1 Tax=Gossypium australe TaxID=47621 RepID=A0A5B6WJW1_9ROSI|nr:hypothetical protein EPI10_021728 [Gossypium australe]
METRETSGAECVIGPMELRAEEENDSLAINASMWSMLQFNFRGRAADHNEDPLLEYSWFGEVTDG